jgi:enediyne biosynthesis protein E4
MRLLLALPAFLPLAAFADAPPIPRFVAEDAGVTSVYAGDWQYMVGGGASAFDCSGDGMPDLFTAGGEGASSLWRNESAIGGALKFAKVESGLEIDAITGAYPLDIDNDGITDLAVMRVGENILMRGLGDCRFEPANEAWGFDGGDAWSTAFAATWEKGQDWPTLAIGNYVDRKEEAFPWGSCTDNWLHRPDGQKFAAPLPLTPSFCALSILFTDWNRSGTPSLRVSNDREYYKKGQEQMWEVLPGQPPRLLTPADGWARLRIWGMGIASHDLNGDTYPDYFLTSMADNKLQVLKDGAAKPVYADVAFAKGVTAHRPYRGDDLRPSTAWHAQIEDVNNDGLPDIWVVKGNVDRMPDFAQADPNNLLLQGKDGVFVESGDTAGVASTKIGRGGVLADFNMDGALDMAVVNRRENVELWRNDAPGGGEAIQVTLRQAGSNRNAIGAWVELRAQTEAGDRTDRKEITVGGGHMSGVFGWWHFGLGQATEAEVRVIWPDGTEGAWQKVTPGFWLLERDKEATAWTPGTPSP